MKYLLITLEIREGEREHTHRCLHTTNGNNINFAAQRYAATYWGEGEREDRYWWFHGEIAIEVERVTELTKYEYKLMSRLFSGDKQDDYFRIVHAGYQHELQREEIQLHAGENGNVFLIKTDEGFIIDVYGQDEHINTLAVWEDDLQGVEPDQVSLEECIESGDHLCNCDDDGFCNNCGCQDSNPHAITDREINDFVNDYGQTHDVACTLLDCDPNDEDKSNARLISEGFIWFERYQKWYKKTSLMYTERDQKVMDYIRKTYC